MNSFYMYNPCWANKFCRTLSICGRNFIACWAYAEPISSHAEHARKCLKVEYLGRIEYDFQKSLVTGPWDHMVFVSAKKVKKCHACVPLNINSWLLSLLIRSQYFNFSVDSWRDLRSMRLHKTKNNPIKSSLSIHSLFNPSPSNPTSLFPGQFVYYCGDS